MSKKRDSFLVFNVVLFENSFAYQKCKIEFEIRSDVEYTTKKIFSHKIINYFSFNRKIVFYQRNISQFKLYISLKFKSNIIGSKIIEIKNLDENKMIIEEIKLVNMLLRFSLFLNSPNTKAEPPKFLIIGGDMALSTDSPKMARLMH